MKQKKVTIIFMMISNWKKHFSLHGLEKIILRCKGSLYKSE